MKGSLARLTIGNEYLFGVAPVLAALQANRRKAVCVHVKATKKGEKPLPTSSLVQIEAAAQALKIKVEHSPLSRLDKLSEGRLHQGVVMECGRLPLQRFKEPDFSELLVRMQRQQQLQADSSSSGAKTKHSSQPHRATWVILDRIQDPMNFGAIIRTCCFFGVDKIIVPQGETCALSPIVSKASAGSLEYAPIISVQNLSQAALMLKQAGWEIWFNPETSVLHKKKQSGLSHGSVAQRKETERYFHTNNWLFYKKHYQHKYGPIVSFFISMYYRIRLSI